MDSSGNLYGTTGQGGASTDDGTVFELAHGSGTITTLASFNGTNGDRSQCRPDHGQQRQSVRHNRGEAPPATARFSSCQAAVTDVLPDQRFAFLDHCRHSRRHSPSPSRMPTAPPTPAIPARSISRAATPRPSCPTNYTFTAADDGQITFTATLETAGTQSITATDTGASAITGSEAGIR